METDKAPENTKKAHVLLEPSPGNRVLAQREGKDTVRVLASPLKSPSPNLSPEYGGEEPGSPCGVSAETTGLSHIVLEPSPGIRVLAQGAGKGNVRVLAAGTDARAEKNPHLDPLPDYRERRLDKCAIATALSHAIPQPSPSNLGEGRVRVLAANASLCSYKNPHLSPLPDYRERRQEGHAVALRTEVGSADTPLASISLPDFLPGRLRLRRGSRADYLALNQFHYVAKHPATFADVWVIRYADSEMSEHSRVVAVGVLSFPVPSCHTREWFLNRSGHTRKENLIFANQYLRTISRVIVHPQFRSLGLSSILVRALCECCATRYIEAMAVMARAHPFFSKAGMTRIDPLRRDEPVYFILDRESISCVKSVVSPTV